MIGARSSQEAAREAFQAARENRELNVRAYQDELVETKDVLEAQLTESFMEAQFLKSLYDHAESQYHLDFVVGKEVERLVVDQEP